MKKIVILLLAAFMVAFVGCKKNDPEPIDEPGQTNNSGDSDSEVLYEVIFNANGATGTVPATQKVKAGTCITLPYKGNLAYSGYLFKGWKKNDVDSYATYDAGETYTVYDNVTFYAYWQPDEDLFPKASFTYLTHGGYTITFVNNSTNATSYKWEFGDGYTSTQASPEHEYPDCVSDSYYTVKLKATNSYGTDVCEKTIAVRPRGSIKIESTSSNPYEIYLDDVYQFEMPGKSVEWIRDLYPGNYRVRVLQVSGYALYPTDNTYNVEVKAGFYTTVTFP